MIKKIIEFLRGGSKTFNKAEERILSAVLNALNEAEREVVSKQIAAVSLVQRQHPDRLVVAYYSKPNEVMPLPYADYEYCLARVVYESRGEKQRVAVVLHHGRIMSLEGDVPKNLQGIEHVIKVELHPQASIILTNGINSEEHA